MIEISLKIDEKVIFNEKRQLTAFEEELPKEIFEGLNQQASNEWTNFSDEHPTEKGMYAVKNSITNIETNYSLEETRFFNNSFCFVWKKLPDPKPEEKPHKMEWVKFSDRKPTERGWYMKKYEDGNRSDFLYELHDVSSKFYTHNDLWLLLPPIAAE